jgi:tetratricopeptide (TPR) repeat protein
VISRFSLGHIGFLLVLAGFAFGVHPATAAHAAIGTAVANTEMPTLDGGKAQVLGNVEADVLVFFRPNQERSLGALRELAQCQNQFSGKSVRWAAIVSSSAPAESVALMLRDSRFAAPVYVDNGDALYASLGLAMHPVLVIVGRDHKVAAFEPFRSVDFCALVSARIRHVLREISDDEMKRALDPPRAAEGGDGQVARRYRAFAAALFKDKNYDKALENVKKSLERDPQLASAHALMGEILLAQHNCAEAIPAFDKALALDPASAQAKEGLERCKTGR